MQLTKDNLKPFQLKASSELIEMLSTFPGFPYKKVYDRNTGDLSPFLCRLKAITGSGKTPMLTLTASSLDNAIILWTTNRGAVISQTHNKLSAGGDYYPLLPSDSEVKILSSLSDSDWEDIVTKKSGLTILLGTVALFNRDYESKDTLNLHKNRNGYTFWQMLSGNGPNPRNRDLYIIYDEAHGTTATQFTLLTELRPRCFILASASPLNPELHHLLPGNNLEEKESFLELQTVKVDTKEVVSEGLLKTRLYLVDCNTSRSYAIKESNDKWIEIRNKLNLISPPEVPIWCGVVNSTLDGLNVWEVLTQELGVDPTRIAVHLANINKVIPDANPNINWELLIDTHSAKKTPENLREDGYTHIIWNLSLREGWDEPWAYVAYLDNVGKSSIDISQKIGRFLRQPNAIPFHDGDLNSAYFYFNVPDDQFSSLIEQTQKELEIDGYEIITINSQNSRPKTSKEIKVKKIVTIPRVAESFGEDLNKLDSILIDSIPLFHESALKAPGKIRTRVFDLKRNAEDGNLQKEENRPENAEIRLWKYLQDRLSGIDGRIAQKNNWRFSPFIKDHLKLKQKIQYGCDAMSQINETIHLIVEKLNNEFRLEFEPDDEYTVPSIHLVSPDYKSDDLMQRERYKVRKYKNALHNEYNSLNTFEINVASSLDKLGVDWCRNPAKIGYGIPIPEIGAGTKMFYPDFLVWTKNYIWAIDPKGPHLLSDSVRQKLLQVSVVEGIPKKIIIAFVSEGSWEIKNERPKKVGVIGYSMIFKNSTGLKCRKFKNLDELTKSML